MKIKKRKSSRSLQPGKQRRTRSVFNKKVNEKSIVDFTKNMAVMLGARLPVLSALETIRKQTNNDAFKAILNDFRKNLQKGKSLSDCLSYYPEVFNPFYISLVRVGESAGILDQVFSRLNTYLDNYYQLKKKAKLALVYPGLILSVAIAAVIFLLVAIVPTFAEMYADFGAELPAITLFFIELSEWMRQYYIPGLLGLAGMLLLIRFFAGTTFVQYYSDHLLLGIPFIGGLIFRSLFARFARSLGTLLENGVPLVDSLKILDGVSGNVVLDHITTKMIISLNKGKTVTEAISGTTLLPAMVVEMIAVGEHTAKMDQMFLHLAETYEKEADAQINTLMSVIEPMLIVILGLVIGLLLIAMYLPMFDLTRVIGI